MRSTQLTGLDASAALEATRRAASAALAVFPAGRPLPEALSAAQKAQVEEGRGELLLVLSAATLQPRSGEDPKRQAELALEPLDRFQAQGRRPTRSYHVRRAEALAVLGDVAGGPGRAGRGRGARAGGRVRPLSRRPGAVPPRRLAGGDPPLRGRPPAPARPLLGAGAAGQRVLPDRPAGRGEDLPVGLHRAPPRVRLAVHPPRDRLRLPRRRASAAPRPGPGRSPSRRPGSVTDAAAQFQAAEDDYQQALPRCDDDEQRYVLHVNRSVARLLAGRLDDAREDAEAAVRLLPGQYLAYLSLADVAKQRGETAEAVALYTKAIERNPTLAVLYRLRSQARLGPRTAPPPTAPRPWPTSTRPSASSRGGAATWPATTSSGAGSSISPTGSTTPWPPTRPPWRSSRTTPRPTPCGSPSCWSSSGSSRSRPPATPTSPAGRRRRRSTGSAAWRGSPPPTSPGRSTTTRGRWS